MLRASVRIRDYTSQLETRVAKNVKNTTREIAQAIVRDIRASWSPESPSPWGLPPAVVSGTLDRSIKLEDQNRGLTGRFAGKSGALTVIRVGASYGGVLESDYLNRPYFEPALLRAMETFDVKYRMIFK